MGTYSDEGQKRRGFIWRKGVFTAFINVTNDHPVYGTVALGINDIGQVVGNFVLSSDEDIPGTDPLIPNHRHGFLRSSKGVFTTLDFPGADYTIAEGINNAGTVVGVYVVSVLSNDDLNTFRGHGFVWSNGVFTTVDVPDASGHAQYTEINSINAKGEIAGFYYDANGVQHGFLGTPVP